MKWTYSIKNKISASIVLLSLCLLVLLSNFLDRIHTQNVKSSISTLYEDRLIAEVYILKMTTSIYEIKEILNSDLSNDSKSNKARDLIEDFKNTYSAYSKTKLTKAEKETAIELTDYMTKFEQTLVSNSNANFNYTENALLSLSNLSTIQVEESKLIMKKVDSQYATIKTSSQFAFAIIIIILVVLQIMVFSGKSLIPKIKSNDPNLN